MCKLAVVVAVSLLHFVHGRHFLSSANWELEAFAGTVRAHRPFGDVAAFAGVLEDLPAFSFTTVLGQGATGGCMGFSFDMLPGESSTVTEIGILNVENLAPPVATRAIPPLLASHEIGIYQNSVLKGSCTVPMTGATTYTDVNGNPYSKCTLPAPVLVTGTMWAVCAQVQGDNIKITATPTGIDSRITNLLGVVNSIFPGLNAPVTPYPPGFGVGAMVFLGPSAPSASVSVSASPSGSPVISPSRSPAAAGVTAQLSLRVTAAEEANVTATQIKEAIGATGTVTILSSNFNGRRAPLGDHEMGVPVVNTRAQTCLSNPYTATVRVLFTSESDAQRLAALVSSGASSVTNSGLCIVSASSSAANGVQPSSSPAVAYVESYNKIAIGLGVGLGVGLPLLLTIAVLAWCCCWGATAGVRRIPSAPAPKAAAETAFVGNSESYEGSYDASSSEPSGYSDESGSQYY